VIPIRVPPLRERKEDVLPFVEHFLKKFGQQMKKDVKGITPEALKKLMLHDWPGNVRELETTIEYAVAMTQKDMITEDYILHTKGSLPEGQRRPAAIATTSEEGSGRSKARGRLRAGLFDPGPRHDRRQHHSAASFAGKYRADFTIS
jgi:two-component system response regulator GlrR